MERVNSTNSKLPDALFLVFILLISSFSLFADPKPGDIFREYHFADGKGLHLCPQGKVRDSISFTISVDDLKGAVRAELTGLFHTGHIGTSERRIRINNGKAFDVPTAEIPVNNDECYFTYIFGRPSVEVSVKDLVEGENRLKLFVGPQICHSFNWPCYGFHSMTIRVYYDDKKQHPTGEIEYPKSGHVINNDELMIKTKVLASQAPISSVDIVGYYYDYPLEGSGKYLDWHYMIDEFGRWMTFINRTVRSPYHETWNLEWIPNQDAPMKLMARVTDADGISYMTAVVDNITLRRPNHSVRMYKTVNVPENFKVRVSETMKSKFEPIPDLSQVSKVQMVSIIPVGHMEGKYFSFCGINDTKLKQYENLPDLNSDFFYDTYLPVDPATLKKGVNEFFMHSNTDGHMTEVCWPGPALLVRYEGSGRKGK
jgi:hypothetical protein